MSSPQRARLRLVAADGVPIKRRRPALRSGLPAFASDRSTVDNVTITAGALWGTAWARRARALAARVCLRFPEAGSPRQARGWAAAILWIVAFDADSDHALLGHTADVLAMTGITARTADRRLRQLIDADIDTCLAPDEIAQLHDANMSRDPLGYPV